MIGGVAAGLTGLGGGQVLTPLFLEMGAPPQTAAATSLLLVFLNSSSAVLQVRLPSQRPTVHDPAWRAHMPGPLAWCTRAVLYASCAMTLRH